MHDGTGSAGAAASRSTVSREIDSRMRLLIAAGGTGGTSTRRWPSRARSVAGPARLTSTGSAAGAASRIASSRRRASRCGGCCCARSGPSSATSTWCSTRSGSRCPSPQAVWWLLRRRPAAVFTTGGYVAIPVLLAARLLGIPTLLWEGNVVPGRSVRATARLASALAVSFEATCAALPRPSAAS